MKSSIVIAVRQEPASLAECLAALQGQVDPEDEVIVCATIAEPGPADPPGARWLRAPASALIPELWARGLAAASGDVVVLTTSHFVPSPDWLACIRDAHRRHEAAGVGGAFDPPRGGSSADWATYFLRYSPYLEMRDARRVRDFAADNASYKRSALEPHRALFRDAFWEPDVHRALLAAGESLLFDPAIRVRQRSSFGVRRFCVQRLHHGRQFGAARMRGRPWLLRGAAALALPLIPTILVAKVARRVLRDGRHLGPFLASLPVLGLVSSAWALGEVWGYLAGEPASWDDERR